MSINININLELDRLALKPVLKTKLAQGNRVACVRCHETKSLLEFYVQRDQEGLETWYDWCRDCENKEDFPQLLGDALSRLLVNSSDLITKTNRKMYTRNPIPTVTTSDLQILWDRQHGKCFFWKHKLLNPRLPGDFQLFIERLDREIGFEKDNMILVCREFHSKHEWDAKKIQELKREYLKKQNGTYVERWNPSLEDKLLNAPCLTQCYGGRRCHQPYHHEIAFLQKIIQRCDTSNEKMEISSTTTITLADLIRMYAFQKGKCAVSGKPMVLQSNAEWLFSTRRHRMNEGFTRDNIRLICHEFSNWTPEMYQQWMACETNTCQCNIGAGASPPTPHA
jgi:hypothetical protein